MIESLGVQEKCAVGIYLLICVQFLAYSAVWRALKSLVFSELNWISNCMEKVTGWAFRARHFRFDGNSREGPMKIKAILVAAALVLSVVQAKAQIPYGNVGTVAPTNVFKATTTGDITGYFVQGGYASGGGAGDLDFVGMLDVTTNTFSGW